MSIKRAERLEKVKEIFLSQKSATAQEIASALGTSRRTVYRYVDDLRDSGFAIAACAGSMGGFRAIAESVGQDLKLSEEESSALLLAGSAVLENGLLPYNSNLESALEKVRQGLSPEAWAEIRETMPNVSIMVDMLSVAQDNGALLDMITDAIAHRDTLSISYHSFQRDLLEQRNIDPYLLFYQGGAWYTVAYCHIRTDIRTFRVDRIRAISLAGVKFERPKNFSLYGFLGAAWGMVRGEPHHVKVRFLAPISRLIAESQWHPTQRIEWQDDGSLIFMADVDGLDEIRRWVLTFAEHAVVYEPQILREGLRASLHAMLSYYDGAHKGRA